MCRLYTEADHGYGFYDEHTPELGLAVWGPHRGQGIGTALLEELERRVIAEGIEMVRLSVEVENPARHLYEKAGYEVVDSRVDDVLMMKQLSAKEG
jgi:GNAT superfamily N-acetyltransferase